MKSSFFALVAALMAVSSYAAPKLAFQVYAVRDLCEKDFAGTLKAAKAMGYEGVETGRFYGLDAKGLKAACDDAGLELVALQLYPHNLTEPQLGETIRFCKECGCRRINVAWYKGSEENANDWQLLVNVLNHAAEVCAKEGIAVAYHNHDHEFRMKLGGSTVWDWLYAEDGGDAMRQVTATPRFSRRVLQELDCGNCVLGGGDPLACIAAHPHRNPTVHVMPAIANVKCKIENVKCHGCGVGSERDMADWKRIIPALVADGVEWLVVKPTAHPDSLADLKASIEYLKEVLATATSKAPSAFASVPSPKTQEVGPYPEQNDPKAITKAEKPITKNAEPITITHEPITICWCPENENALSGSRKDFRERAKVIWEHLAENPDLTVRELSVMLRCSLAATQGAINALKECGLLVKIGQTRGSKWIVKTLANDTEVVG